MRTLKSTDTDLPGGFSSNNYNLTWSVRLDLQTQMERLLKEHLKI